MYGEYMLVHKSPKNWGYYVHAHIVCTRLSSGRGDGDEATSQYDFLDYEGFLVITYT